MNFKKLSVLSLGLLMATSLIGCKPKPNPEVEDNTDTILKEAAEYVWGMYYSKGLELSATGSFDVVNKTFYEGEEVAVNWTLTVPEAMKDAIKLTDSAAGNAFKTVYVGYYDGLITTETNWSLTASFTYNNKTITMAEAVGADKAVLSYTTPKLVLNTNAEYLAQPTSGGEAVNIKGVVTGVLASGSSQGSIYFSDAEGYGYYLYNPATKLAVKPGDTIVATGIRSVYNGQEEFGKGGTYGLASSSPVSYSFIDATTDFANAPNNKTFDAKYQNRLVELHDVHPGSVEGKYYYFTIGESKTKYNVYSDSHLLTEAQETAWQTTWNNAINSGATFTIKGIATVYSNAIQIYPTVLAENVVYDVKTMTAEEKAESVIASLTSTVGTDEILSEREISFDIPSFATVTLEVTEGSNVTVTEDNKLLVKPTAASATTKVKATVVVETVTKETVLVVKTGASLIRPTKLDAVVSGVDLVVYQEYPEKTSYLDNTVKGTYYIGLNDNPVNAATYQLVERTDGKYDFKVGSKFITLKQSGNYWNVNYADEAGEGWSWNATYKTITFDCAGTEYYLGSYNQNADAAPAENYQRIGGSKLSYIKDTNYNLRQFPIQFALANKAIGSLTAEDNDKTYTFGGVVIGMNSYKDAFVQDSTGILFLYDNALKDVETGSYVTIEGKIAVYNGLIELKEVKLLNVAKYEGNPELVAKEMTIDEYIALDAVENNVYYKITGGHLKVGTYKDKNYVYLYNADESKYAQTDTLTDVYTAAGISVDLANKTITGADKDLVFYGLSTGKGKLAFLAIEEKTGGEVVEELTVTNFKAATDKEATYLFEGVVAGFDGAGRPVIIDAKGDAALVYDTNVAKEAVIGDTIKFQGKVTTYNGLIQLTYDSAKQEVVVTKGDGTVSYPEAETLNIAKYIELVDIENKDASKTNYKYYMITGVYMEKSGNYINGYTAADGDRTQLQLQINDVVFAKTGLSKDNFVSGYYAIKGFSYGCNSSTARFVVTDIEALS